MRDSKGKFIKGHKKVVGNIYENSELLKGD